MLVARDLEIRAGSRLLLQHASFQVAAGDKIGLVGRNGAGKTTLTKILSGEALSASGSISRSGAVDTCRRTRVQVISMCWPRTGSFRRAGSTRSWSDSGGPSLQMADDSAEVRDKAMAAYARAEAELAAAVGTPQRQRRRGLPATWDCLSAFSTSRSAHCLAGSDAASSCRGSCLRVPDTLLLDEPTNHLDADSIIWLRSFLASPPGRPAGHQP